MFSNLKAELIRVMFYSKILRKFLYNYKNFKKLKVFENLNLNKNSLFIDVGANEGIISQYIFDKYQCNIEIYEPHPSCLSILRKKFKNNAKIKIFDCAVSENTDFKKLYFHKNSNKKFDLNKSQATSLEENKENIDKKLFINVKTYSIKDILNNHKMIDCIKIDIEGHEYKILPEIIINQKKIKKVFCELHGNPESNKNQFLVNDYNNTVSKLKNLNLYNSWLIEHF